MVGCYNTVALLLRTRVVTLQQVLHLMNKEEERWGSSGLCFLRPERSFVGSNKLLVDVFIVSSGPSLIASRDFRFNS